jgi:hypothetical protein
MGAKLRYLVARGEEEEAEGEIGRHRGQGLVLFEEKAGFGPGEPTCASAFFGPIQRLFLLWQLGRAPMNRFTYKGWAGRSSQFAKSYNELPQEIDSFPNAPPSF